MKNIFIFDALFKNQFYLEDKEIVCRFYNRDFRASWGCSSIESNWSLAMFFNINVFGRIAVSLQKKLMLNNSIFFNTYKF